MSSDLLHSSKVAPVDSTEDTNANIILSQATIDSLSLDEKGGDVVTYGELHTQVQTPSPDGAAIEEGFDGTNIDLLKTPFPINNDLFEGLIHVLMRDLPGNTYDFDGDKDVLWEIQIQVRDSNWIRRKVTFVCNSVRVDTKI